MMVFLFAPPATVLLAACCVAIMSGKLLCLSAHVCLILNGGGKIESVRGNQ